MYRFIALISFLFGSVYTARAFMLIRTPGELPMTNTYPLVIGILLCLCALGVYVFGTSPSSGEKTAETTKQGWRHILLYPFEREQLGLFVTLLCFIIYTFTFEKTGTIEASFLFSFILGTIWNRSHRAVESAHIFSFIAYLAANKINIAENILVSCLSVAGIWLVFEKIFSLSLP